MASQSSEAYPSVHEIDINPIYIDDVVLRVLQAQKKLLQDAEEFKPTTLASIKPPAITYSVKKAKAIPKKSTTHRRANVNTKMTSTDKSFVAAALPEYRDASTNKHLVAAALPEDEDATTDKSFVAAALPEYRDTVPRVNSDIHNWLKAQFTRQPPRTQYLSPNLEDVAGMFSTPVQEDHSAQTQTLETIMETTPQGEDGAIHSPTASSSTLERHMAARYIDQASMPVVQYANINAMVRIPVIQAVPARARKNPAPTLPVLQQPTINTTWQPATHDQFWSRTETTIQLPQVTQQPRLHNVASNRQRHTEPHTQQQPEPSRSSKNNRNRRRGRNQRSARHSGTSSPAMSQDVQTPAAAVPSEATDAQSLITNPWANIIPQSSTQQTTTYPNVEPSTISSSTRGWSRHHNNAGDVIDYHANWNRGVARLDLHSSGRVITAGETGDIVVKWLENVEQEMRGLPMEISFADYQRYILQPEHLRHQLDFDTVYWTRAIVPAYWKPQSIDGRSPAAFWHALVSSALPIFDEQDLEGVKPWWVEHPPHEGIFVEGPVFGLEGRVDPAEDPTQRALRRTDQGSNDHAIKYRRNRRRTPAGHNVHTAAVAMTAPIQIPPRAGGGRPRVPLFIRRARWEDMEAIAKIMNYYINETSAVISENECIKDDMVARWRACEDQHCPVLVACQPSYTSHSDDPRSRRQGNSVSVPEIVIGYALSTPRYLHGQLYPDNKEVQVFVDPQFKRAGVATSLLDKMFKIINPCYIEKMICEADLYSIDYPITPDVQVKSIWIEYLWDADDKEHSRRIQSWLCTRLGMQYCYVNEGFAVKDSKTVDMHTFKYSFASR